MRGASSVGDEPHGHSVGLGFSWPQLPPVPALCLALATAKDGEGALGLQPLRMSHHEVSGRHRDQVADAVIEAFGSSNVLTKLLGAINRGNFKIAFGSEFELGKPLGSFSHNRKDCTHVH